MSMWLSPVLVVDQRQSRQALLATFRLAHRLTQPFRLARFLFPSPPLSIPLSLSLPQHQRLLMRHGCAEQGGSYVNYPVFVSSFTAAVRGAEPASAVAAVAAANATNAAHGSAAAASAEKNASSKTSSGTVSGAAPARRSQGGGEPAR